MSFPHYSHTSYSNIYSFAFWNASQFLQSDNVANFGEIRYFKVIYQSEFKNSFKVWK